MYTDSCLRADYSKYEVDSSFFGSIVSAYSKINKLIYIIEGTANVLKNLIRVDEYKYYKKLPKRPILGSFFVYYSATRNSFYRAFNLGANPVEPTSIKALFLDTGEIHYIDYDSKKFFFLPDSLCFPVMALFCKINSFPKHFKSVFDLIEQCGVKKIKLRICDITSAENELGTNEICLVVDIEEVFLNNKNDDVLTESDDRSSEQTLKLTKSTLQKFEYIQTAPKNFVYENGPFMLEKIPQKPPKFQPSSKVILYPSMMLKANLFYGFCKNVHEAHKDTTSLTNIMIKMNKFNVTYEKLGRMPILKEMVLFRDDLKQSVRFYRGMVLEIFDDIAMVLYVDYGKTRPIHYKNLFKFPIEFSTVPFHYHVIHATNVELDKDEVLNHKNMIIINRFITPFGYGVIEKIDGCEVFLKLYDDKGINMKDVLMRINKPLRVPKKKFQN